MELRSSLTEDVTVLPKLCFMLANSLKHECSATVCQLRKGCSASRCLSQINCEMNSSDLCRSREESVPKAYRNVIFRSASRWEPVSILP